MRSVWTFSIDAGRSGKGNSHLSDFETVVYLVLEWAHSDLADQFWLDDRLLHDKWQEKRLVVSGRVESRKGKTAILELCIPEHKAQHADQCSLQDSIECFIAICESIANSLDDHSSNRGSWVLEIVLK
jgi:hypothetical protein